jgi:hypothetical protein
MSLPLLLCQRAKALQFFPFNLSAITVVFRPAWMAVAVPVVRRWCIQASAAQESVMPDQLSAPIGALLLLRFNV